ncbi:L,D-transpeptidase family protein [Aneurinibacillus thermoaerophilus]|uniref:L,D-transpeptidase family protein n=1 Tax=Aneurinibacillus thermoaerophilus TaxID=143495 RepID=UPI002E1DD9EE|nr:L,D-transpeptidase family protein [Aneurinibacillus thermoaerophilus]MED0677553.1 L,D-transpeptidase family protein [Aneurinibacillus thermoaerophilus]
MKTAVFFSLNFTKLVITLVIAFILAFILCTVTAHSGDESSSSYEIRINLWYQDLQLIKEGKITKTFKVASGALDTPSPVGIFRIVSKDEGWGGGFGSCWLGLNVPWGTYGIHGTNKPYLIGQHVSHGCFRMRNRDIEELYEIVPIGTKVIVEGPITGHKDLTYRVLVRGSRGALVQLVQNRLQAAGFYQGKCHGIFDWSTEQAVIQFQKQNHLPVTKQIHDTDLLYLGIIE